MGYNSLVKRASISEAKNQLSALIDRVRQGQSIVIEDRGVPVARLEALSGAAPEGRLARLEREGIISRPVGPLPAAGIEETERIAAWLEQPGSRLMELDGDWAWPLHATLDHPGLMAELAMDP